VLTPSPSPWPWAPWPRSASRERIDLPCGCACVWVCVCVFFRSVCLGVCRVVSSAQSSPWSTQTHTHTHTHTWWAPPHASPQAITGDTRAPRSQSCSTRQNRLGRTHPTPRSWIPQGTMWSNAAKFGWTFKASPWEVTQREADTPMAATLVRPPLALGVDVGSVV
jgi:hypothetical protein